MAVADNQDGYAQFLSEGEKRVQGTRLSRFIDIVIEDKASFTLFRATAADISVRGMRVITSQYLPKGSIYTFTMRRAPHAVVRGEIRWIEKLKGDGFRAGVCFVDNPPHIVTNLEAFMETELKKLPFSPVRPS